MNNDLIRRSDLLAKKCMVRGHLDTGSPCPSKVKAVPVDVIEREPAVDAVPVRHGRWRPYPDCGVTRCSVCDWSIEECIDYKYFPNCGADMRGGGEDD